MKKSIIIALAAAAALTAAAENYKVIVPLTAADKGAVVLLEDFDTNTALDSATVVADNVVFTGDIDESVLADIKVNGQRRYTFILEPGALSFNTQEGSAFGTMLNDQLRSYRHAYNDLGVRFNAATTEEEKDRIYAQANALADSILVANDDNALGYYMFLNSGIHDMDLAEVEQAVAKYPAFAGKERVKKHLDFAKRRQSTQPGGKFIDFEITQPDGTIKRLSDYVGRGKYTLVDFWASWCGPCIRQTGVLKDIYNKYKDDGRLDVLGVAVWDEVDNTRRAIEKHQLPWECILDAQSIPTDIYGITGIPCIILFGPDGTILSRDKQDDDLRNDVDKALGN